ncbi:response regulator, partial [Desulfobacterales bacterium HSG2]|nr:response regulator [Desulfobacterales bacterium HSG2]
MIVDDENAVHKTTMRVLEDFSFEDRWIRLLDAYSAEDAKRLIREHPDTAVIILDVVMETDHAGLGLVRHIREELGNRSVRIILRTGQPGKAPEKKVVIEYDINDYRTKAGQTAQNLFTALISSLRSYRDLGIIKKANEKLNNEIAERKKMEEDLRKSEERFRNLFENSPVSLWEEDFSEVKSYLRSLEDDVGDSFEQYLADHPEVPARCAELVRIIDINQASLKLHGAETKEELLEGLATTFTPDSYQAFMKELVAIREGRHQVETDALVRTLDGIPRYVSVRWQVSPGYEETLSRVLVSLADISERKKSEDRLAAVNVRLEELVDKRTAALAKAAKKARIASKAKGDFLARMSHEIRTPLNAIINMTWLLSDTDMNPEQRDCVSTVLSASDILLTVINDILDFSKIEAGKLDLEITDFSIGDVIAETVSILKIPADEKKLALTCRTDRDVPTHLRGDPVRLRQILLNLANNAVKFTEKGEITVCVSGEKESGAGVLLRFSVTDTGIGIPKDRVSSVFESFSQADVSTTRKYGGTGLGLAISKRLAEMMGGEIGAESEEGKGSTFWFTACFEKVPEGREIIAGPGAGLFPAEEDSPLSGEQRQGLRILLAEDSEMNRKVALGVLEKLGFSADVARNGGKAVEMLGTDHYDLVLMDIRMPETDGLEATRIIRDPESGVHSHGIPIIAMTADATAEDRKKCVRAGMNDYVSKPFRPGE